MSFSAEHSDLPVVRHNFEDDRRRCHLPLPIDENQDAKPVPRLQNLHGGAHANLEVDFSLWLILLTTSLQN